MNKGKEILICNSNSSDHQMIIYYCDNDRVPMVHMHVYLKRRDILKRLLYGFCYIFGKECNYSAFDEYIFNKEDLDKVKRIVDHLEKSKIIL